MKEIDEVQGLLAQIHREYDPATAKKIYEKMGESSELNLMFEGAYNQALDLIISSLLTDLEREFNETTALKVTKTFAFHQFSKDKYLHRYAVAAQRQNRLIKPEQTYDQARTA
ncbi:MAG: hypothetical protein ABIE22_02880 [archaeon]